MQKHYNVDDVYDVAVGLEQALDGLQDNDRIKRLTVQASALIQMFASVLCVRTIPPTSERQIDGVMQSIGQRLGIDYAAEKERYLSQCQSAPKATQAKAQAATLDLALPPFSEMVRPWVIKELRDEYEAQANEAAAEVERLEKPPASWTGTKKAYLEQPSTKNALDRSREQRDEYRKIATRLRNGSIDEAEYPSVVTQINTSIRKAEREQNGVLTKPQRDARVISLLLSIFADEDAGADLDFYPTPDDIIARYMFDDNAELISEIPPDATILEPSAGRGNIADEISKRFPKAAIDVVELSDIRREVLYHKGYNIVGTDFMQVGVASRDDRGRITLTDEYKGKYDAVFMNPPFLKGQGREHVKRALDMVAIDGVLVAVMPTSWIDGTGQDNAFFQDHVKQRADVTFKIVKESEYNANHSRKITIDIAIATMVKRREVEQIDEDEARASHDAASREIVEKWSRQRVQLPTAQGEVDKEFIPPKIITARPEITSKASEDFIPTTLRKRYDFVKDHVYEGANKAIEGLNRTGGFLLADGTGTGKTIQALLVARHYWATTGQPVMIFTVDDRVIQGSFFADARKLGWDTPDLIDTATSERPNRPRNYSGLYDDATPTVSLYKRDRGVQDGINVTTYNTLSNWKGLESVKAGYDATKTAHENMVEEYENKVAAFIKTLDIKYPKRNNKRTKEKGELGYKKELEAYKEAIQNQINDDPRTRELYVAKELLLDSIKADMRNFMSTAQLVIFDEAHKIKNAGDGLDFEAMSIRAQLALGIIDQVPRVLYMTATPADRPFDVLYLKKLGFWRDNKEFRRGMYAIGYKWQEPLYNSRGEQVASGRWSKTSTQTALDVSRSNGEMRRLFQLATEDGNMIRREIQLTNLTVKIHKFPAPKSALDMMETVREEYTEENEKGHVTVDYNAMTMVQMQELERYKIDRALELIDQAVTSGKQVVTFCYTVEEQEVQRKKKKATKAGTVEVLKNILAQRYGEDKVGVLVGTDNDYEDFRRLENVQNFQSGKVRVLIGTITSGGTGVNLDDVTGRNPREMVVITPPLSFINVMQGVGRIVRANTKSRSTAHFIFTDNTPVDEWLSRLLATKFETLNATVEGETNRLSLSQSEETEDTGSQGVISLIASNEGKDKVVVRKHPRRVKGSFRHNGWEMTNNTPYYVTVEGTPKNSTLIIGGRTRADLDTLKKQYGDLIERLQLKPNINRNFQKYNGPHYGRWFGNRDETYDSVLDELLNIVDPRLESAFTSQQEFKVGDEALVAEAIDWAGLPTGTLVRVVAVRARMTDQESWRYDVEHEGKLYKSILGQQLKSVAQEQTVEIDPVGTVLEYNGETYRYHQENRWSRPTSYSSVVKRIATIKSFDGATVMIDVRAWVIDGRTKENDDETLTEVTCDVLDYEKRRKIAFEEISYDGKTGKETGWQRRYNLVSVTQPNKQTQTPEYKMVADDAKFEPLLPPKATQQMSDRLCNLQNAISEIDSLYRQWAKKVANDDSTKAARIRIESEINRLKYAVGGVGGASGCESCPPREANGELCITDSCLNQLESICEQAAQTWSEEAGTMTRKPWDFWQAAGYAYPRNPWYTQKTGFPATVERFKLHKRIIDDLRDKTTCAASLNERLIAVLTGGAPGSGKSSFIREEAPWLLDPDKFMHIDADAMREKLPEYAGWNATLTHEEASTLVKIALKEIAHPCQHNVLYDGTMNNVKKYAELVDTLEELGYDVYVIYMEIPEAVSKQRVLKRYQRSGRYVPRYVIEDFYKSMNTDSAFEKLKNRVKGWVQVNGLNREVMKRGGEAIPTVGAQNGKRIKQDKTPESFAPPQAVQDAAKRGLELRRKHNRGGTEVGVARARDLSNGRNVSLDTIKRMHSYFQRHEVDKRGKDWGNKQSPSAGYIAWQLWGGDAGRKWAAEILGQQEKKKPVTEAASSGDVIVKQLPIDEVHTDTQRFQPRSGLSEEKVMAIVNNYDARKFDPIVVWQERGKYYVLAGHHRLAAAERMKLPTVPVRVYEGSEADAITYAWTSNIMTRTQTNVENAGYLRKLRSNGVSEAAIKRTCDEYYSKDCATVFALSHVPATAIVFDDMSAFTAASDEYKELETMARWLGIVCKQHDTLTVSQVNELYRFLRKNFRISGRRFRSAAEFSEYVDKALATRFPIGTNDGTALNLENLRPRTDTEKAFDAREAEITQEIADEKKLIETQRTKLLKVDELRAKGIPATAEPILDSMRKSEQRIASLQRELMELRDQRSEAIGKAVESQPALFGLSDRESKYYSHWYRVVPKGKQYGIEITDQGMPYLAFARYSLMAARYPTETAAHQKAKRIVRSFIDQKTTLNTKTRKRLFEENVSLAEKVMKRLCRNHNGEFVKTVSRSSQAGPHPSVYLYCHMTNSKNGKQTFMIRIADHLTSGRFHDGELPFKNYALEKLHSKDIHAAFKRWNSGN
jgi:predicted ABC-type ATPase